MSVTIFQMKVHSREKLEVNDKVNVCVVHKCKPEFFKIISGRSKYIDYVAFCKSDDCTKIGESKGKVIEYWNKWNPENNGGDAPLL